MNVTERLGFHLLTTRQITTKNLSTNIEVSERHGIAVYAIANHISKTKLVGSDSNKSELHLLL